MFAMSQASELDAAAHIARVDAGSGQLVHAGVFAFDQRSGDQGHAAADHVHGDNIEALFSVRRQLAKICAEQIRKRPGSVDAFVPAAEGSVLRTFDDGGADDSDWEILAVTGQNRFAKAFSESVSIRPAQVLRAPHAYADELVAHPAAAIAFEHGIEFAGGNAGFIGAPAKSLAAQSAGKFGTFGALFDVLDRLA